MFATPIRQGPRVQGKTERFPSSSVAFAAHHLPYSISGIHGSTSFRVQGWVYSSIGFAEIGLQIRHGLSSKGTVGNHTRDPDTMEETLID